MAVYKIFPQKDASIYTISQSMNTGLDEILEASTYIKFSAPQVSRYLLKFSDTEIKNILGSNFTTAGRAGSSSLDGNYKIYLNNYAAVVSGFKFRPTIKNLSYIW